jgi:hypothetical protein
VFDTDKACPTVNRMWLKLARRLEKMAHEATHVETALKTARAAEACYWQATGESDSVGLKDLF